MNQKRQLNHYAMAVVITLLASLMIVFTSAIKIVLPADISTLEVLFYMNVVTAICFFTLVKVRQIPIVYNNTKLVLLRAAMGFVGVYLFFFAYETGLSLSAGIVISRLVPIVSVMGMIVFMKEKIIGSERIVLPISLAIAIFAVVIIADPFGVGTSEGIIPVMLATASGLISGLTMVVIRKLMETDKPELVGLFNATFVVAVGFILMLVTGQFRILAMRDYGLLVLIGIFNTLAVFLMALSTVFASPTKTAPYFYSSVVFAPIVQFILFSTVIARNVIIGAILIIVANLLHFYISLQTRRKVKVNDH